MANQKTREKRRAARLRKNLVAKQTAVEQEELEDEELEEETSDDEVLEEDETPEEEETEKLKKDYGMEDSSMPMMIPVGPTSWDEYKALETAREQAEAVDETTWTARQLVNNIMASMSMTPEEKGKAIAAVGEGFPQQIQDCMDMTGNVDVLEAEAMIAKDFRDMPVGEKVSSWIEKKTLSYKTKKNLPDSEYALVYKDPNGNTVRKYVISDKAHVRNALARAAQQIKAGGEGAADAKKALPKIHAAAKKMGIGQVKKEAASAIMIEKDATGAWRWVGWVSNNFKDRSGDIITEAAHKEYVDWVNKDMGTRAPVFTSCHAPFTVRENPADFVGYENGFLVMSGALTENEAASLLRVQKSTDIGMSHTSWGIRDPHDPKLILKYRMFEVTDLPVQTADNPFTTLDAISKEDPMNSEEQLKYLTTLLGSKKKAEQALSLKTSMAKKELTEAGVESKETPAPVETPAETAQTNLDMDAILKEVETRLDIPGLNEFVKLAKAEMEKVPLLEEVIKQMKTTKEEEVAKMIEAPVASRMAWSKRPSQATDNVVKETDELLKQAPKLDPANWLSQVTNTEPLEVS